MEGGWGGWVEGGWGGWVEGGWGGWVEGGWGGWVEGGWGGWVEGGWGGWVEGGWGGWRGQVGGEGGWKAGGGLHCALQLCGSKRFVHIITQCSYMRYEMLYDIFFSLNHIFICSFVHVLSTILAKQTCSITTNWLML